MATFLATLALLGGIMLIMSIGVMVHGRRLKGSCGQDCKCSPLQAATSCEDRKAG